MDKKKFDPNFLREIQSGSFPGNTLTHQIIIHINQESIETVFAYDHIKNTTKINNFNRCYHVPTELIDIFLSNIKQFNNKKAQQLQKDIKNILQSTNDYREQLILLQNHIWKLEQHKNHLLKDLNQDVIIDYIQERINAKILNQRTHNNQEQQLHTKILTTGEKIRKFSPLLKDICDHIIHDIHINFKAIHKTTKSKDKLLQHKDTIQHIAHTLGYNPEYTKTLTDQDIKDIIFQDLTETTITIYPREKKLSKSQFGTSGSEDTKRSKQNKQKNIREKQQTKKYKHNQQNEQ